MYVAMFISFQAKKIGEINTSPLARTICAIFQDIIIREKLYICSLPVHKKKLWLTGRVASGVVARCAVIASNKAQWMIEFVLVV